MKLEEGREVIMVESKEKKDDGECITFKENDIFEIPKDFPPRLPDTGIFLYPLCRKKSEN